MKISLDYMDGWWTLDENINDHIRFFIKIFQYWLWVLLPGKRYLAEKAGVDRILKHSRSVVGSFTVLHFKDNTLQE